MALGALPEYPWDLMVPYRKQAEAHRDGLKAACAEDQGIDGDVFGLVTHERPPAEGARR